MTIQLFGQTSQGLPILSYHFSQPSKWPELLVLGGVHGDEIEGVMASRKLIQLLLDTPPIIPVTIVPEFNPEGVLHKTRGNLNGVDLNRNLPTKDWSPEASSPRYYPGPSPLSESENRALVNHLDKRPVKFILSLHSWHPMLNINGDCLEEAQIIQQMTGYRIDPSIGYPTPGCLGTYAGLERNIPTLTYEIERGQKQSDVLKIHIPAIKALLKHLEQKWNN